MSNHEFWCNFERPPAARVGLVVPTFGRPQYVEKCLASLAASRLDDCVVCLVDETRASLPTRNVEGFKTFSNVDSPGGNLQALEGDFEQIASAARAHRRCVAFDSVGCVKSKISWLLRPSPGRQLLVRHDYLERRPWLRTHLKRFEHCTPDPRTEELVRAFSPPGLSLIKLYKARHANMHDSILRGHQALLKLTNCEYLGVLDSDTLLQPNWLQRMLDLHREFSHLSPLLVTGFHTRAHPTLEVGHNFRRKASVGGLSLLFDRQVWSAVVEPSLRSSQWDRVLSEKVIAAGGSIVATRPSVVDHIGRQGVWSHGWTFDRAEDFPHSP